MFTMSTSFRVLNMLENNNNNDNNNSKINTPTSSDSDTSRKLQKSAEDKLMVAVRIRPLKQDESQRCLYAVNKKVSEY